jgi:hypothetical protein
LSEVTWHLFRNSVSSNRGLYNTDVARNHTRPLTLFLIPVLFNGSRLSPSAVPFSSPYGGRSKIIIDALFSRREVLARNRTLDEFVGGRPLNGVAFSKALRE